MGKIWKQQIQTAADYGNFPGQPMVEGKDNLVALPSGAPSTAKGVPIPAFQQAKENLEKLGRKVPKHIHRIIHDQFLANEMGQKGEKFWAKWDLEEPFVCVYCHAALPSCTAWHACVSPWTQDAFTPSIQMFHFWTSNALTTRVRQNLGLQMHIEQPLPHKLHASLTLEDPGALLLTAVVKVRCS